MSDLGELDHPGTPSSPGAWDARSGEWLEPAAQSSREPAAQSAREPVLWSSGEPDKQSAREPEQSAREPEKQSVREPEKKTRTGDATPAARRQTTARRTAADPVKALMHRHRELCQRAVDPLEIAAGLEAHGVTDRTATRFRHRDVFALAEEMYARVARDTETPAPATPPTDPRPRTAWALLTLLPGALCAAAVIGLHLTHGQQRLIAAGVGALAVGLALRAALSRGPLSGPHRTHATGTAIPVCWLAAYALLGYGLLRAAVAGGPDALPTGAPDGPWPLATAPVLALTLSCAPAAWCAHFFAARARRRLTASRALQEFASSVQPLLLGAFALYLGALTALLAMCGAMLDSPAAYTQAITLGALLFLARLLTIHGFTRAPSLVLAATAAAQAVALTTVFAARLPGWRVLASPVKTAVTTWGPASLPALTCGAAALTLLLHAIRKLTKASAHAPMDGPC